jgi:hypothetical protein
MPPKKKSEDIEGVTPEELRDYKDELIAKIYHDEESGFKSKAKTYKLAHEKNPLVSKKDVDDWFQRNKVSTKDYPFENSYIAHRTNQEYQMDLFQMNRKSGVKDWEKYAALMVDIFSKYTVVQPIDGKTGEQLRIAIHTLLQKMNLRSNKDYKLDTEIKSYPRVLYSDQEPALKSAPVKDLLNHQRIELVMTSTHAAVAERQIRTFKRMIVERLRGKPPEQRVWHDEDFLDRLSDAYNNEQHSTTGMTPVEARKQRNAREVNTQLELHRLPVHHYPRLAVGDVVRKLVKKKVFDKETVAPWSEKTYRIAKISHRLHGQPYFTLEPKDPEDLKTEYMQRELLLVHKA